MSRSDILSIAAIAVALILGIPPIVALATDTSLATVALIFLLGLVIAGLVAVFAWYLSLPNFTIISFKNELTIHNSDGTKATLRKTLRLRPNRRGLQHHTHRSLSADGPTSGFRTDPDARMGVPVKDAGVWKIPVTFSHQRPLWRPFDTWLEVDFEEAFCEKEEGFAAVIDPGIKELQIDVILPREPKDCRAIFHTSGMDAELHRPSVSRCRISWSCRRKLRKLTPGEYEVRWIW